jgi:hypothetical protein
VIVGSGICTHRPSLSFVVNEIIRNKVVVPEGAAGLIIGFRSFLLVEFSFTLSYFVVRFDMI